MFSNKFSEIIRLQLNPGEKLDKHSNPYDVVFYILEGNGELTIEDEVFTMERDYSTEVRKGVQRSWYNPSDTILRLLVVKYI